MINLAKAIGRIVVSYKEVQNLAGYTTLIHELDEVLSDLSNNKYKRVMVTQDAENQKAKDLVQSVRGGAKITPSETI